MRAGAGLGVVLDGRRRARRAAEAPRRCGRRDSGGRARRRRSRSPSGPARRRRSCRCRPGPTTAKPWFCEVISILPVSRSLTGWLRAAVAERQLEGLEADRAAEQLVAEADAEDRPLADQLAGSCRRRSRARPGRRGRWRGRSGRDRGPGPRRARSRTGSSVTRQPRSRSCRMIERLIPVSIATTCGPSPSSSTIGSAG